MRALKRQFGSVVARLIIIEDELTVMEVVYNPITRSTVIKTY